MQVERCFRGAGQKEKRLLAKGSLSRPGATLGLRHGLDSHGGQQWGILDNGRKPDPAISRDDDVELTAEKDSAFRRATRCDILEEGGDDVKSAWPLWAGPHTCYNGNYNGKQGCKAERIRKDCLSSDCSLQLGNMKLESLVIADQHAAEWIHGKPISRALRSFPSSSALANSGEQQASQQGAFPATTVPQAPSDLKRNYMVEALQQLGIDVRPLMRPPSRKPYPDWIDRVHQFPKGYKRAEWKGSPGRRIRKLETTQSIDLRGLGTVQSISTRLAIEVRDSTYACGGMLLDSTATHPESTIDPSPEPLFLSSLPEPQNDSEAARIPQCQQAISEEFPVLQKTSFITISDREGFQTSKDHY
ncbi:hypothetical protein CQW23_19884 [Capsicum baccatum]|uniref:Uncharacterized protein n=1 Tax=Capsicum baccatum TaxID=33114 RepID=A0A2G2W726_CAPBA|nr:hypothetical protein CQW23_19884 [Capsicum baccatum]